MGMRCGKYELGDRLAVGGMAEVFLATASGEYGFSRRVVVKRLLPHLAERPDVVGLFLDEARLLARLHHPRVVQVLDLGTDAGACYQALEHLDGLDLSALLLRGPVPVELGLRLAAAVAEGLAYVHAARGDDGSPLGIVHGDLSPGNVVITRAGEVKLIDFGVARWSGRLESPRAGTPGFIAPEVEAGGAATLRSDLFGLGKLLEKLVPEPRMPLLGRALLETLLAADPTQRPATADEVLGVLNTCIRELGSTKTIAQLIRPLMPERKRLLRVPTSATMLLTAPVRALESAVDIAAHVAHAPGQLVDFARRWPLGRVVLVTLLVSLVLGIAGFASGVWVGWGGAGAVVHSALGRLGPEAGNLLPAESSRPAEIPSVPSRPQLNKRPIRVSKPASRSSVPRRLRQP